MGSFFVLENISKIITQLTVFPLTLTLGCIIMA